MGTSTDGQICFGVYFEEEFEFPWADFDDIDDWWIVETGWKWEGENPYTPEGEYAPGFNMADPRIDAYHDSRREWRYANPCPVVEVNYQSSEYPAYILAVPSSLLKAYRGYPKVISANLLTCSQDEIRLLVEFCDKYKLEYETPPCWYLSSYWG